MPLFFSTDVTNTKEELMKEKMRKLKYHTLPILDNNIRNQKKKMDSELPDKVHIFTLCPKYI